MHEPKKVSHNCSNFKEQGFSSCRKTAAIHFCFFFLNSSFLWPGSPLSRVTTTPVSVCNRFLNWKHTHLESKLSDGSIYCPHFKACTICFSTEKWIFFNDSPPTAAWQPPNSLLMLLPTLWQGIVVFWVPGSMFWASRVHKVITTRMHTHTHT